MNQQASVISYFFQAGGVVKTVMLILLFTSIVSWTLIIQRAWYFRRMKKQYQHFTQQFWQSQDLSSFYKQTIGHKMEGLASIFQAGFKEFLRLSPLGDITLESIQRAMGIRYAKETERLQQHLPLFASIGSIAPYVGLFGTVWGIMTSFQALGQAQQATIAMVAPGISEALVATALGLFTAIPAVIAFNRYSTQANTLLDRYDLFQDELIALIAQQAK